MSDQLPTKEMVMPHGPCCECDSCTDQRAYEEAKSLGYKGPMKWLCPVCTNPTTEQGIPCSSECGEEYDARCDSEY